MYKYETWERLKELERNKIVEQIKLRNIVVIKLRKSAVCFLLGKNREEIASVQVNITRIMKSAFINEIIHKHICEKRIKPTFERVRNYYKTSSTFLCAEKENYKILQKYHEKGVFGDSILAEVELLRYIEESNKGNLRSVESNEITDPLLQRAHNMNCIQTGGVYIDLAEKIGSTVTLHVAMLDLSGSLTGVKVSEKLLKTYHYLDIFKNDKLRIHFVVYTYYCLI
ncbi:hypothetical protein [Paenibacillus tianmuensis]|nr:hypothetical protein [Paenibacillus tianmuensis]